MGQAENINSKRGLADGGTANRKGFGAS